MSNVFRTISIEAIEMSILERYPDRVLMKFARILSLCLSSRLYSVQASPTQEFICTDFFFVILTSSKTKTLLHIIDKINKTRPIHTHSQNNLRRTTSDGEELVMCVNACAYIVHQGFWTRCDFVQKRSINNQWHVSFFLFSLSLSLSLSFGIASSHNWPV